MDVKSELNRAIPSLAVSDGAADRVAYARDLWPKKLIEIRSGEPASTRPSVIAWPESTEDVAKIVRFARDQELPIVPFGAGSGVCGGVLPDPRAIVVDLKRLGDFRIDPAAPLLDVGPGALGITLEEELERRGYTIGHFPSSILCSTVGGWIAARGAGQCSGLYGKIEDMVVALECVLGTGEVVRFHRRRSGPSLTSLMIGSEGTLGVVTRAELRLHPQPRERAFAAFSFPDLVRGWTALRELFQRGLRPAVARLYDPIDSLLMKQSSVKRARPERAARGARHGASSSVVGSLLRAALRAPVALNAAIKAAEGTLLPNATLVLVFEGRAGEPHADVARARELCTEQHGEWLGDGPARAWYEHRYSVSYRQSPVFRLGAFSDTMEVAAPWSRLEELYRAVRRALGRHVLVLAHLSHAYPDGCSIYFTFSGAAKDDAEAAAVYDRAWRDALAAAIEAGATLSHHHGVGRSKAPRLGDELGFGVELVRRVMRAWDPSAVMNPGNLVPKEPGERRGAPPESVPGEPISIDEDSLTVTALGTTTLGALEARLAARGLTLGLSAGFDPALDIARFVAQGLPGTADPWSDPVRQPLAGLVAEIHGGGRLVVRPAPRRSVGPDLCALFVGAAERIGVVEQATLTVERVGVSRARTLPFEIDRDPALDRDERSAWERLVSTLTLGGASV